MKNILKNLLIACFIIISSCSTAQSFREYYLGKDFLFYEGSLFKVDDKAISGFIYSFYSDITYCFTAYNANVVYPSSEHNFVTIKDSLVNRIFKVEKIIYKSSNDSPIRKYYEKPIFILRDTNNQKIIYYLYDKNYESEFPFLVSNVTLVKDFFCSQINETTDDFTDEILINNPVIEGNQISPVILYKSIINGKVSYRLGLRSYGSTVNVGQKGVYIIFDNGTKLNKPSAEIDVDVSEHGYCYSAYITLSSLEVKMITEKRIKKYRLFIYDTNVNAGFAEKFTCFAKCIVETKK